MCIRRLFVPLAIVLMAPHAEGAVSIQVDAGVRHQTIAGFGATHGSFVYGTIDVLGAFRAQAIDAMYNQVRLNTGNLEVGVFETLASAADTWGQRQNDDADPFTFNPAGWNWTGADTAKQTVVDLAAGMAFTDYYLGPRASTRWEMTWATPIRSVDYGRYIDELAEHVTAAVIHWRDAYGIVPPLVMPVNEPLTGNGELAGANAQEVVNLVKRLGQRLRQEGFASMKLVVPGEETEESSLSLATAILSDPQAAAYVGAIAYHTYPYGSVYSDVTRILSTSGSGAPDPGRIAVRGQLRDLAASYGVPLYMTEVSHGGVDPRSFDSLRARAVHIHDEFVYADASAYFGMTNSWDMQSQVAHFGNRLLWSGDNEGNVVQVDQDAGTVTITGIGYAIGHYARWIRPGSARIEAASDAALVQVTAYRDDVGGRIVLVLINNGASATDLTVSLAGSTLAGDLTGEQSTAAAAWQPLPAFTPAAPDRFAITLPAWSVTTVAGPMCAAAGAPGDLGNSLLLRRGALRDDVDALWSVDPLAATYNLYRRTTKNETLPAVPYLTAILAPPSLLAAQIPPPAAPSFFYHVAGVSCAGAEGP
jgi:O-glycosyl hydrolase